MAACLGDRTLGFNFEPHDVLLVLSQYNNQTTVENSASENEQKENAISV